MALLFLSLENRISQALELIPPPHRLPPQDEELFATLKEGKKWLQDSEFPDLDIPSVRENLTQSQPRLYTLSENVDPAEIVSSSKGITTQKSRGVLKKSRAQLEWESAKVEALTKKLKYEKHQDNIEKQRKRKWNREKKTSLNWLMIFQSWDLLNWW